MRIVGLDPGGTTGVAYYDTEDHLSWKRSQLGPALHHMDLWTLLSGIDHPFTIVCESFQYRTRQRDNLVLVSVEYIGVAKLFDQMFPYVTYAEQTPAYGKAFWTDEKIRALNLWETNMPHAMDATRHVLQYISFQLNDLSFVEKLRPER